jgi:type I restriction enzyme, R subunit
MSYEYSEDNLVEQATQDVLESLGWEVRYAYKRETMGTKGFLGRADKTEIILKRYLHQALVSLNAGLPEIAYQQAIEQIEQRIADKSLGAINKEKYQLFKEGVPVSYTDDKGILIKKKLRVFDFKAATNNHFLAVRQLEIAGELYNRRPDVIGFVNGIPLVFFELKAHHTSIRDAFDKNITDYKDTIPAVFHHNAFIILSNGTDANVGTVTSKYKFFLEWKRIEEDEEGIVSLDTLVRGTCDKNRLMDIFENFLLFDDSDGEVVKIMAKNHQFLGVNKVINQAKNIEELKGKLGVFWHTQGSGKSYSIVFICEKIHRKLGGSFTFLIVADRTELETQLYDTFSSVGLVNNKDLKAKGREHLRTMLKENNRYVFSLIQKFSIDPKKETEYPLITERSNIIVISDEAHRTQGGTFARNMRFSGIPNASYLGFTGTPLIAGELEQTKNIFGEYVSVYDFKRAIEDNATLPLKYINRGERLDIDNPDLDDEMADILEDEDTLTDDQRRKLSYLFQKNYVVLTAEARLDAIAKDLVWHFNERGYQGKAMLVALDKPTAVRMYDLITKHWKVYLDELKSQLPNAEDQQDEQELKRKIQLVEKTEVCVIVSPEQNEVKKFEALKLDITSHRRKMVDATRDLAVDFKDENHPFRLAIVCAMWITGFDAPCVSTIYLDKPIKGHTLMQTIARANRVYDDEKENGLIVDYGNVYKQLEKAYATYGEGGKTRGGDGGEEIVEKPLEMLVQMEEELAESIKVVTGYLSELGFELAQLFDAKAMEKLALLKKAADCVCLNATSRVSYETAARLVFRKYKALYPETQVIPHTKSFNAIEAIYNLLNQRVNEADVNSIIWALQKVVNESIFIDKSIPSKDVEIDLSKLDFEKLRAAFLKAERKNTIVFDLQEAIDNQLQRMLQENPLRMEFYDRYIEIIKEYNNGKSPEDVATAFDDLTDFLENLTYEDARAMRENLDQETLAIFDLLREGKDLEESEKDEVKIVAKNTLKKLKKEKLTIERWRESRQITAQVKTMIYDNLQWLPSKSYTDLEVGEKVIHVYQHVYSRYGGGLHF